MLQSFVRRSFWQTKRLSALSTECNFYSTKESDKNNDYVAKNIDLGNPDALDRMKRCLVRDMAELKRNLMFWKDFKNPAICEKTGRVIDWDDPHAPIFPNHCDIVIIGGGAIGSSVAYFTKLLGNKSLRVVVVEKDDSYKQASTVLSVGGLRQQFSLPENIEMSLYGAEFIRNANEFLGIEGEAPVDLQFHPYGYLSLATEETAEILQNNSALQRSLGAKNVLLSANQLKSKFPWLNVENIELGCLGLEKEGWFDPWMLLCSLKRKAYSLGVNFVKAEAVGFNFEFKSGTVVTGDYSEFETPNYLVVRTEDGKLRPITFSECVIAAGAFSGDVARMVQIGTKAHHKILSIPLPIEPRKRYVYCFHAPDGPGLNTPMTIDPSGMYFRREGLNNNYICGLSPEEHEEPATDNLDVDYEFFNNKIWPKLANRVPAFENLKVKSAWAGFYEYNTFDENGVIGYHPYHSNILFATGFSGHGIQKAPAVGRAVSELIKYSQYKTIDLSRLGFDRFITEQPLREVNIW
ncbi:FAD-dependent oxidoreductase domain-containing protein 1 [Copidosoma floridanum]|uniref:FAD-dependent oxidoreductase domain-containing protein 1 n=1 Tax=Copidosoma floridanum TaxID=29053 RepID=UPI0006C99A28|nr:FAD-dependent oxidoreductase domain-containing protein 1 [Copidosoma floridanum]